MVRVLRNGASSSIYPYSELSVRTDEFGRVPEIHHKKSLRPRLWRSGSAPKPTPLTQNTLPRDACQVSACSMLRTGKGVPPDLPPGPFTYREVARILGVHFKPARKEDPLSGGTFALRHAGHAVGLDAKPSPSGEGLGVVTIYDGNFPQAWRAKLDSEFRDLGMSQNEVTCHRRVLRALSPNDVTSAHVLFQVRSCNSVVPEHPSLDLLAGSDAPTSDTIILRLQKELAEERERFWKNTQAQKGSGSSYERFPCVRRPFSRGPRLLYHVTRA